MDQTQANATTATAESAAAAVLPADGKPEEIIEFIKNYSPAASLQAHGGMLDERFIIRFNETIPSLSCGYAYACEARDDKNPERELYALICPEGIPYRSVAVKALLGLKHPHMVELVGAGAVDLPANQGIRHVLILEKPMGIPLSQMLKEKAKAFPDGFLASDIVRPIAEVLKLLEEKGICHGHLNLNSVYYSDKLVVGQCVALTPGLEQDFLFEPVERILSVPLARGEDSVTTDSYALGIITLHLAVGGFPFVNVTQDAFISRMLSVGSYNTLANNLEFSEYVKDMLRGTLIDNRDERWTADELLQWVEGKRFNLITPTPPKDAPRAFEFEGREHHSFKSLAHALHMGWDSARVQLRDNKISRWVELSAHKREIADLLDKAVRNTGGESTTNEKHGNELVARSIIALDPTGPIRYRSIATSVEGIGQVLTDALLHKKQKELGYLTDIIENDLPSYWADQQKATSSSDHSGTLWKLQKTRMALRNRSLGFGMERALYDLNSNLPCQSPLVIKHLITDMKDLLITLDALAPTHARDHSPLDRHIAAFLTSRLDVNKEIRIMEFAPIPGLATHPDIIALRLLRVAQDKSPGLKLPGLCAWLGLRLFNVVGKLHNRKLRNVLYTDIKKVARSGNLDLLYAAIVNGQIIASDQAGFLRATDAFRKTENDIVGLEDMEAAKKEALDLALKLSLGLSYLMFCTSLYFFAKQIQGVL